MGILTDDMKRVVRQQRLGFVATVCPDGTPNLSPKGTASVWDDDHLLFADLASPVTMENLRHNPAVEINLVDLYSRKGYRFKGRAHIVEQEREPDLHEEIFQAYEHGQRGVHQMRLPTRAYVLVTVERALPLVSPAYVPGKTERETREVWAGYWAEVHQAIMEQLEGGG
ncbi:MAG: pyridoxamine 5'-phosphate oxidase family protein [Chloroflexota bacterium]|nr:pyridoxamine 5'-phosphate oxidase family protein [Chloroflexota bacterium]